MKQTQTTIYKREISFLDADRKKATIEVEITGRNGYPEFTMSGEYCGSLGQCLDNIKPSTDEQKELIKLWKKYHLNSKAKKLPEDFEDTVNELLDTIQEQEEERAGEPLFTRFSNDDEVLDLIEDKTDFDGRDAELCAALCKMFDLTENDLSDIEIDGNRVTVQGDDYLAGDDDEMTEELTDNIKESAWAFNSSFLASFCDIDEDVFKVLSEKCEGGNDAILSLIEKCGSIEDFVSEAESADGRGHFLNRYDGGEESATINGTEYFAYRN